MNAAAADEESDQHKLQEVAHRLSGCRAVNSGLTIVITGASSGIGLAAAKLLVVMNPNHRIVLVARTVEKARRAKEEVERHGRFQLASVVPDDNENRPLEDPQHQGDGDDDDDDDEPRNDDPRHPRLRRRRENNRRRHHLIALGCDQSSLDSVRQFCDQLKRALDDTYRPDLWTHRGIDVLCLNAAVLLPETLAQPSFTSDGIETTFQTNYLAPFLMLNLLHPVMNPNGRVLFSTSGLHLQSPTLDVSGGYDAVTGRMRPKFHMVDGSIYHYKRAYTLSKLCNVALCQELHALQQQSAPLRSKSIIPICFSPGLMLGSGLFRHQDVKVVKRHLANTKCVQQAKTVEWGAGALVYVALSDQAGHNPNMYWSDESLLGCSAAYGKEFRPSPLTEAVLDDGRRKQLWDLSVQLAQLQPSEDLSRR